MKFETLMVRLLACLILGGVAGCAGTQDTDEDTSEDSEAEPSNLVVVSESSSDTVAFIDTTTDEVVERITVGEKPNGLAVDRERGWLYVSMKTADGISVIDLATREVAPLEVAGMGHGPIMISLTPDGSTLLVTTRGQDGAPNADDTVDVIALEVSNWPPVGTLAGAVSCGVHPIGVQSNADGTLGVVTVRNQPDVLVFDIATQAILMDAQGVMTSGAEPEGLDFHPIATEISYVVRHDDEGSINVLDVDALTYVTTVATQHETKPRPSGGTFSPDGSRFFLSGQSAGTVFAFDTSNPRSPVQLVDVALSVGKQPHGILFLGGERAYVANTGPHVSTGDSISILADVLTNPVVAGEIEGLAGPLKIVAIP